MPSNVCVRPLTKVTVNLLIYSSINCSFQASVAAPFTAGSDQGIECVPLLIREGRAALVTSFGMFKFMALYSLIQFITLTILYSHVTLLSDIGFMYVDLVVIDVVALTMSRNYPCKFVRLIVVTKIFEC